MICYDRHSIDAEPNSVGDRLEAAFQRQAKQAPDAVAILHRGSVTSYRDLETRSNRIAHRLRKLGVGPEVLVALCLPRTPDMIAAMLGILKAGGGYLPLDPAYPASRLQFMIEDSKATVLIIHGALPNGLHAEGVLLDLSSEIESLAGFPSTSPPPSGDSRSMAYVIYTSGSTGLPKGVVLEHTAARFISWAASEFVDGELACVAAASSICFDPSVFEIFAPLSTGGTILLKDSPIEPFTPDERPTMLNTVPSVMAEMAKANSIPDSVRVINIGGEKLTIGLVHALYQTSRAERIYNHYGPTEATTCTTVAMVRPDDTSDPPLGRPICGAEIRILRSDDSDVDGTDTGEIHIGGPMLARGYANDPVRTAERFVPDPANPRKRLYRTGDMGRWSVRGVEFVARSGDFIKRNGFRIAPGEIESALLRLPGIQQAAVSLSPDEAARMRLVAYLVGDDIGEQQLPELRRHLREWLPLHMLPDRLQLEASLPLTLSGKVDRNALPALRTRQVPSDIPNFPPLARAAADVIAAELNLAAVGPDDDFYELGGDSLQAIGVALQLEFHTGRPVSAALIAQAPTPRLLSHALELEQVAADDHLVLLQAGDSLVPPLFCLPDIHGRSLSFISLAREFGRDLPVYGLAIGPAADALVAHPSIDLLMDRYVAVLHERWPGGPYRIAGYSFGGRFAHELARRLHVQGASVSLVLIDAPNPLTRHGVRTTALWASRAWRNATKRDGFWGALRTAIRRRGAAKSYLLRNTSSAIPRWVPEVERCLADAHLAAIIKHKPLPFAGATLIVVSTQQFGVNRFVNMDGMLGWRRLLNGPVERVSKNVGHHQLVRPPFSNELAARMKRFFRLNIANTRAS